MLTRSWMVPAFKPRRNMITLCASPQFLPPRRPPIPPVFFAHSHHVIHPSRTSIAYSCADPVYCSSSSLFLVLLTGSLNFGELRKAKHELRMRHRRQRSRTGRNCAMIVTRRNTGRQWAAYFGEADRMIGVHFEVEVGNGSLRAGPSQETARHICEDLKRWVMVEAWGLQR